jgi:NAD dependent epimerase/dehydratase family enzyme
MTYGPNISPVPNLGVAYNILTSNAIAAGFAPYVGDGTAVASTIHVIDGVNFLNKIVTKAGTEKIEGSAYERYYIVHGERVAWKDMATALGKALHAKGAISSPEPRSVGPNDAGAGEIGALIGGNMLVKGDRAEKEGFKVTQPSMLTQMAVDFEGHDFGKGVGMVHH